MAKMILDLQELKNALYFGGRRQFIEVFFAKFAKRVARLLEADHVHFAEIFELVFVFLFDSLFGDVNQGLTNLIPSHGRDVGAPDGHKFQSLL